MSFNFIMTKYLITPFYVTVQTTVVAPSDCLACSILNLIFCNCLFGAIAVGMSCAARSAFDRGERTFNCAHNE